MGKNKPKASLLWNIENTMKVCNSLVIQLVEHHGDVENLKEASHPKTASVTGKKVILNPSIEDRKKGDFEPLH